MRIGLLVLIAATTAVSAAPRQKAAAPAVRVKEVRTFKQVGCGCCELWARHMRAAGFTVTVTEELDLDRIKRAQGVPASMASCHTSTIGGYVIEGHVPADVVQRLLTEKPPVKGIAVPGMPIGSPGMEQGSRKDLYNVLAFDEAGRSTIYTSR